MGVLDGRVAIVTGAGGGIGREHALALAAAGARVVVNDTGVNLDGSGGSDTPAASVVAEIGAAGGTAVASFDSVADYDSAGRILELAMAAFGQVDVLVNNASVFRGGPFEGMSPEDFSAEIAVHLIGTFNMCKHALPIMARRERGRVINTSSSSWYAGSGLAGYAAVKAGVLGLSFDLAAEYRSNGVTVNVICPIAMTSHRAEQGQKWVEKLRQAGVPEEVLQSMTGADGGEWSGSRRQSEAPDHIPPIVIYLASDAAANVTGRVFEVTGNVVGVFAHPAIESEAVKDPDGPPWTQAELEAVVPSILAGGRGWREDGARRG